MEDRGVKVMYITDHIKSFSNDEKAFVLFDSFQFQLYFLAYLLWISGSPVKVMPET